MKPQQTRWLLLGTALAALAPLACSGDSPAGTDTTADTDTLGETATVETDAIAPPSGCLGADPSRVVEVLSTEAAGRYVSANNDYQCSAPYLPWVNGPLIDAPQGGWAMLSGVGACATDVSLSAMVRIKEDGTIPWAMVSCLNLMMTWGRSPQWVLPAWDGFLLGWVHKSGNDTAGFEPPLLGLERRDDAGDITWTLPPEDLRSRSLTPLPRHNQADLWFAATRPDATDPWGPDTATHPALVRVAADGQSEVRDLPGGPGEVVGALPGESAAFILVLRQTTGTGAMMALTLVTAPWSGDQATAVEVKRWNAETSDASVWTTALTESDWLVHARADGPNETLRLQTSGTVAWHTSEQQYDDISFSRTLLPRQDKAIVVLNNTCIDRPCSVSRSVITSQGAFEAPAVRMQEPSGTRRAWRHTQALALADGWLVIGQVAESDSVSLASSYPPPDVDVVAARYDADWTLRWARRYGVAGPETGTLHVRGDDAVLAIARPAVRPGDCIGFGSSNPSAVSLLVFDGICE